MNPADLTFQDLRASSADELERIYATDLPVQVPTGCFRGKTLMRIDNPGARKVSSRIIGFVGFEATPFGIDFDESCWYFWHPRLRIGAFRAHIGPSRWRDTEAVTLHYEVSRLPQPIRGVLYDEVKPLSPTVCLGMGGLNAGRDQGDHFFFALARI
jgi:hypothetical protein